MPYKLHIGSGAVPSCRYGESSLPEMQGLERHEVSPAFDGMESLLIVEASGIAETKPTLDSLLAPYLRDFTVR